MAGYAYFDKGEWVENLTAAQIKALAAEGIIQPHTFVRLPNGKEAAAGKIQGLEFGTVPEPVVLEPESC